DGVAEVSELLQRVLRTLAGQRVPGHALVPGDALPDRSGPDDPPDSLELGLDLAGSSAAAVAVAAPGAEMGLGHVLALAGGRVGRVVDRLRQAEREAGDDESNASRSRRDRALLAAGHLAADLARLSTLTDDEVAWVDGGDRSPSLRVSPIDVGPLLSERLWGEVTGVLTSATVPLGLGERLGLPAGGYDELDVGSPFDYRDHALLYVANTLPDRRRPESEPALHDELAALITAAGGRTLALFTSWRSMRAAVEALRDRLDVPVLAQSDLPKPALVEAFRDDESTCLFATLGFWQGVDVPGRTLSLVTVDRIPFPRPDEPVLQARRQRAGAGAFRVVDLPRAGTLLAQGAGRLIRSAHDRGVVAVLDSRLATASYRGALLARVPPMKRTVDRGEVEAFLARITAGA
ncbi:MAG TPA: ATP-dependent DNA helicase, partial [Acidimicrobiales bacterium]|nr:ATP-dependent DNA helicase [Acidimicrobiales bacterium]